MKKAFIYTTGITIMFVVVMLLAIGQLNKNEDKWGEIGDKQKQVIEFIHQAEEFYIKNDQYALYATEKAILELSENGGLINGQCGELEGYNLWNNLEKNCIPDKNINIKTNLRSSILNNLKKYLTENSLIQPNNYELYFNDTFDIVVYGLSLKNIYITLDENNNIKWTTDFKYTGRPMYSFKPNFMIKVDYNLSEYNYLVESISEISSKVISCENEKEFEDCVNEEIEKFNSDSFSWEYEIVNERMLLLTVTSLKYKIPYYQRELSFQKPTYKFGYYVQDLTPKPLNLELINPQGEDKYVMVKWKTEDNDISYYNLYSSDEKFTNLEEIENRQIEEYTGHIFFEENCQFFNVNSECQHIIAPITTSISLSQINDQYLCSGEYCYYITDDVNKQIYITAVDNAGNEIKEGESIELITKDNLALGIVSYNAVHDGTKITITNVKVTENVNTDKPVGEIKEYIVFINDDGQDIANPNNQKKILGLGEDFEYTTSENVYIGVIAIDKNKNPLERTGVGEFNIKKEYELIINDLANAKLVQKP